MGHVQLDQVEAGAVGAHGRLDEGVLDAIHLRAIHLLGRVPAFTEGQSGRTEGLPGRRVAQRVVPFPGQVAGSLAARVGELNAHARGSVRLGEIDDALPGCLVLVGVHAGAAVGDAAVLGDVGHLGDDEAGASDGAAAEVDQVPILGGAVDG